MGERDFILKGNVCYSENSQSITVMEQSYLVCVDGISQGVFGSIPEEFKDLPVTDWGDRIIIPGLVDLHLHAPQYAFRGLGMDLELLDWLNQRTFPEESKYIDSDYAKRAYTILADNLKRGATTRACIFATIHKESTRILMDLMEETGLKTMIGKVNMDRNSLETLCEESAQASAEATIAWIEENKDRYQNVSMILTPRFIPSCTDELMRKIKQIQETYQLPVQSHLSENQGEIAWVQELCPESEFYGDAYDKLGLFGGDGCKTIMAHCVSSGEAERKLMKERGVFVAHCPESNSNLSSGIAPLRKFMEEGLLVGLGTDIAGGTSDSIFSVMVDAIQLSKMRWRLVDQGDRPLTAPEAFYLATKGGGAFFGSIGSFEAGFECDAIVLDDSELKHPQQLSVSDRLERMFYLSDNSHIAGKYVMGNKIF